MYVVATAGHVDHGKSTLLRALTGMEPDRWAQERERGMTIDLGYVWSRLPSGADIAFVDVPGHQKFVGNMLAGVGPVPAVLFVVAADAGWMPQSAEHLAILDALGVHHGLLVLTRADLADPQLAEAEARDYLRGTSLADIESVAVSAVSGAGIDRLWTAVDRMVGTLPEPERSAPVRLWVDRMFTIRGSGTVVTGTLGAGTIHIGDELQVGPSETVRVRGLQVLQRQVEVVSGVARVALNVRAGTRAHLHRGEALLTPQRWQHTDVVDAWLDLTLPNGAEPGPQPTSANLHIGSARIPARIRVLGTAGDNRVVVRIRLSRSLPLHVGDRALLRNPNQTRGHRVLGRLTVLDVYPPALRRRGAAATRATLLGAMTQAPDGGEILRQRGLIRRSDLLSMGCAMPEAMLVGDWLIDPEYAGQLTNRLTEVVTRYLAANPLEPGMPVDAARNVLELPDRRLVSTLVAAPLRLSDGRISPALAGHGVPEAVRLAVESLRKELSGHPFQAPEHEDLVRLGLDRRALAVAEREGLLLRIGTGVVLLPEADVSAVRILQRLLQPFTASTARQALDTTRRVIIPLLEYLDRRGFTERVDEGRRRCLPAA